MATREEIIELIRQPESFRVEKSTSTTNMDKFCEAICAFANDLPDSRKNGYLLLGGTDDGKCGLITRGTSDPDTADVTSGITEGGLTHRSYPEGSAVML